MQPSLPALPFFATRTRLPRRPPSPQPATPLTQFDYKDVQLLDGPMLVQFQQNHALFLNLNEDSILKPFRQLSGLPAPGEDLGGWYSPSPLFDPPKNMTGYVPGHTFGQWLSALSRAYAITGDKPTQDKVHRLVAGFAPTISKKFYEDYCLPAYTFDKTNCGLIDAHQFAADPQAFAALNLATDAVLPFLPAKALDRTEMAARPHKNISWTWDETYTLPENFYLAYQRGAGARYRQLAQRFLEDDTYFGPLALNKNILPGQHAYSHVNGLCSAMQAYLTDGSQKHLTAAKNGFAFVLAQSYVTGGWGPNEGFVKPETDELAESLTKTHSSFETPCGAYGQFKVTRYLMRVTGDSRYGDAMETMLYNTILGARPIRPDGVSFYYADYNNEAKKVDYEQKWPCCSGTFPQLTADYGISSYLRSAKGINVNLYVPSRITWQQGSARASLTQHTQIPRQRRHQHAPHAHTPRALHHRIARPRMGRQQIQSHRQRQRRRQPPSPPAPGPTSTAPGKTATVSNSHSTCPSASPPSTTVTRRSSLSSTAPSRSSPSSPAQTTITQKQLLAAQRIGNSSAWEVATETSARFACFPIPTSRTKPTASTSRLNLIA